MFLHKFPIDSIGFFFPIDSIGNSGYRDQIPIDPIERRGLKYHNRAKCPFFYPFFPLSFALIKLVFTRVLCNDTFHINLQFPLSFALIKLVFTRVLCNDTFHINLQF